jgi:O-antigen/teichoic acid export membrane protein
MLGGLLSQGIGFLLFPFYAHVFSPHDFGILDLIGLALAFAGVTIGLEISQGLGRYFLDTDSFDEKRTLASTALWFTLAAYTLAAAVAFVFLRPLTDLLLGDGVPSSYMAFAIAVIWCSGLLYLSQCVLQYQLRPRAFSTVSVVTATVNTGSSALLVLVFHYGVTGALTGQLAGCAAGATAALYLARRFYIRRFNTHKLRRMLAFSVPLIPASVSVFLNAYADRIAIRSRLTLTDVGVYAAGYRVSMVVSILLLGVQGAVTPLIIAHYRQDGTELELARVFRLFTAIALAVFLLVSLFADEILRILTQPAYYGGAEIVPFVVAASFLGGMYVFAPGLNIAKRMRPYGAIITCSALLDLALAFALVGPLGISGPAIAFLVACTASFTAIMALSQRYYRVPHDWRRLLTATAGVVALVALGRGAFGGTVALGATAARTGLAVAGLGVITSLLSPPWQGGIRQLVAHSRRHSVSGDVQPGNDGRGRQSDEALL